MLELHHVKQAMEISESSASHAAFLRPSTSWV